MRILFVENHAGFAQQVCSAFLGQHEVTVKSTLASAYEALERQEWDVVLVDYDLDDGKGIALVQRLIQRQPRPKLVAVSAFEEKNDEMLRAGADAVCGKLSFSGIGDVLADLV